MSTNKVQVDGRLTLTATTAHTAGDLVWCDGYFGVVQDDVAAGDLFTLICEDVWRLPRTPSTVRRGAILAAPATEQATTLPLLVWTTHPSLNSVATTGWYPIGKSTATGNATTAPVALLGVANPHNFS